MRDRSGFEPHDSTNLRNTFSCLHDHVFISLCSKTILTGCNSARRLTPGPPARAWPESAALLLRVRLLLSGAAGPVPCGASVRVPAPNGLDALVTMIVGLHSDTNLDTHLDCMLGLCICTVRIICILDRHKNPGFGKVSCC